MGGPFCIWYFCIQTTQKKFPKATSPYLAKVADIVTHAFKIFSNVTIIVVQHSMSQFTITPSLSSLLEIFPYCAGWFHMNYGLH